MLAPVFWGNEATLGPDQEASASGLFALAFSHPPPPFFLFLLSSDFSLLPFSFRQALELAQYGVGEQ